MIQQKFFKYLFLSLFVLMLSCQNDGLQSVPKPRNLVERHKLALVLADMHLAEAGLTARNLQPDSLKRMNAGYYDFILNKHGVSRQEFEASFDYYLSIPMEMDTVYNFVVDEINNRESLSKGVMVEPATAPKPN